MKKLFMIAMAAAAVCSCAKGNVVDNVESQQESTVYITIKNDDSTPLTRASGNGHGTQVQDNTINTVELFIFRVNPGQADDGILDGYKKFNSSELETLSNLEVKSTIGKKMIYAVVNSHRESWPTGLTRTIFEQQTAQLFKENIKDFLMVGGKEATLQISTNVSFQISRMVARVRLNSVVASFENTPYAGGALKNVKAYLINAHSEKYLFDGSGNGLKILNSKQYVANDNIGSAMPEILYEELSASIDKSGYSIPHYFYCYSNPLETETENDRFTRLVIEGELNGTKYYYPISLKGIARNSCYSIDVKIQRPGSQNPDQDVAMGTMYISLEVLGWNAIPGSTVEF